MVNYYQILQLDRSAKSHEFKRQFRKLALQFHPDKNDDPAAAQKFIELTEAYEILSNPIRRKHYNGLLDDEQHRKIINERKRQRWEKEMHRASYRGQAKGQNYAENFDYFSKKVMKETAIKLLLNILGTFFFEDIGSWLGLSFFLTIGGLIVLILNWGSAGLMALGLAMAALGFLWFKREVRREYES